jgi:hypothetical protein
MRLALPSLIFLMSFYLNANVITFPENIIVISVNDVEQSSHFFARETKLDLAVGNHVLVLKYQDLFDGDDDHTKVKSKPFVVLFTLDASIATNELITAETPHLDELKQAKQFAKNPKIKLLTQSGREISSVNQSLLTFNAQGRFTPSISAVETRQIVNIDTNIKKVLPEACKTPKLSDFEQLKCLWKKTSKVEQQAFIYFILAEQQTLIEALSNTK